MDKIKEQLNLMTCEEFVMQAIEKHIQSPNKVLSFLDFCKIMVQMSLNYVIECQSIMIDTQFF